MNRVFVTGVGTVCTAGLGRSTLEGAMLDNRSRVATIRGFDATRLPVRIAAEVPSFDAAEHVPRKMLGRTGRFIRFALAAAGLALRDAELEEDQVAGSGTGVAIASNLGGEAERAAAHARPPGEDHSPFLYAATANAMATAWVSIRYGAEGPGYCLANSSASGNMAIGLASRLLRWGEANVMLAGAAEAPITPFLLASLDATGVLSRRNDDPARAYRPFDRDRTGICVGEGAAVLVLETESHAAARGAHPLAEIAGYGAVMEAHDPYRLASDGRGARRAICAALGDAGLPPQAVGYVNAHGTGTRRNDLYEAKVLWELFGERPAVSSTKPLTGHLLGAAGAIEAAVCVLALETGVIPATANLEEPDVSVPLDFVRGRPRESRVEVALNLSWGFGGYASALLLKRG